MAYSPAYLTQLQNDADSDKSSVYTKENARGILKISEAFSDKAFLLMVCIFNLIILPVDACLRFMQKADSDPDTQTPLLYSLLVRDIAKNPFLVSQRDLSAMVVSGDSKLGKMLLIRYRQEGADLTWWVEWCLRSVESEVGRWHIHQRI